MSAGAREERPNAPGNKRQRVFDRRDSARRRMWREVDSRTCAGEPVVKIERQRPALYIKPLTGSGWQAPTSRHPTSRSRYSSRASDRPRADRRGAHRLDDDAEALADGLGEQRRGADGEPLAAAIGRVRSTGAVPSSKSAVSFTVPACNAVLAIRANESLLPSAAARPSAVAHSSRPASRGPTPTCPPTTPLRRAPPHRALGDDRHVLVEVTVVANDES